MSESWQKQEWRRKATALKADTKKLVDDLRMQVSDVDDERPLALITERVTVWGSICNGGDGSAYVKFFLTEGEAFKDQETATEPWGEECYFAVETYAGSKVHKEGKRAQNEQQ